MWPTIAAKILSMNARSLSREVVPFTKGEQIMILEHSTNALNVATHYHPEYEISFIRNGRGLSRTIGDITMETDSTQLLLLGPDALHGWQQYKCNEKVHVITINFSSGLLRKLHKNAISLPAQEMLLLSRQVLLFNDEAATTMGAMISGLHNLSRKETVRSLKTIINSLVNYPAQTLLPYNTHVEPHDNLLYKKIHKYLALNYSSRITLHEVSELAGLTQVSFNRFIKKHSGKTFINYLNSIKVSYAARSLAESDLAVADIAIKSGFNNIAHFNRVFKNLKGITPVKYRELYFGKMRFL